MPPKVPEEYKEERRSALLTSAMHCFAEKGYHETTIDDIVRHAKASKGAVYHYFKSKEEIYLQLQKDSTEKFFDGLYERFQRTETASDRLRYLLEMYRNFPLDAEARSKRRVNLEFFLNASRIDDLKSAMETRYEQFIHFFSEIVLEGIKTGEFRSDLDIRTISSIFWGLVDGISLHYTQIGDVHSYEKIWREIEDLLFRHLR